MATLFLFIDCLCGIQTGFRKTISSVSFLCNEFVYRKIQSFHEVELRFLQGILSEVTPFVKHLPYVKSGCLSNYKSLNRFVLLYQCAVDTKSGQLHCKIFIKESVRQECGNL